MLNLLKFALTLGNNKDLVEAENAELTPSKYGYSQEFKDLVFEMMAYNHKQRPTLK